jgi:hypothetical protein
LVDLLAQNFGAMQFTMTMTREKFRQTFGTRGDKMLYADDVLLKIPAGRGAEFTLLSELDSLLGGPDWRDGEYVYNSHRVAGMKATYSSITGKVTFQFRGCVQVRSARGTLLYAPTRCVLCPCAVVNVSV